MIFSLLANPVETLEDRDLQSNTDVENNIHFRPIPCLKYEDAAFHTEKDLAPTILITKDKDENIKLKTYLMSEQNGIKTLNVLLNIMNNIFQDIINFLSVTHAISILANACDNHKKNDNYIYFKYQDKNTVITKYINGDITSYMRKIRNNMKNNNQMMQYIDTSLVILLDVNGSTKNTILKNQTKKIDERKNQTKKIDERVIEKNLHNRRIMTLTALIDRNHILHDIFQESQRLNEDVKKFINTHSNQYVNNQKLQPFTWKINENNKDDFYQFVTVGQNIETGVQDNIYEKLYQNLKKEEAMHNDQSNISSKSLQKKEEKLNSTKTNILRNIGLATIPFFGVKHVIEKSNAKIDQNSDSTFPEITNLSEDDKNNIKNNISMNEANDTTIESTIKGEDDKNNISMNEANHTTIESTIKGKNESNNTTITQISNDEYVIDFSTREEAEKYLQESTQNDDVSNLVQNDNIRKMKISNEKKISKENLEKTQDIHQSKNTDK